MHRRRRLCIQGEDDARLSGLARCAQDMPANHGFQARPGVFAITHVQVIYVQRCAVAALSRIQKQQKHALIGAVLPDFRTEVAAHKTCCTERRVQRIRRPANDLIRCGCIDLGLRRARRGCGWRRQACRLRHPGRLGGGLVGGLRWCSAIPGATAKRGGNQENPEKMYVSAPSGVVIHRRPVVSASACRRRFHHLIL